MTDSEPGTLDFGDQSTLDSSLSNVARGLHESGILQVTRQVRAMIARGEKVVNLTVGDFDPRYFPIPKKLSEEIQAAIARGETNYPTPEGMLPLRQAISDYVYRQAGVRYPLDAIVVCRGGRPVIYGTFRTIVDRGDKVLYSVPSWQNDAYSWLAGGESIEIEATAETGFQPTLEQLAPHLSEAALLCLCSPGNPTGTVMSAARLTEILQAVVAENRSREAAGRRPLFVVHDQMYGSLVSRGQKHTYAAAAVPEAARYVIAADGVSKAYAGTGLRLGWMLAPPAVAARIRDLLSHAGAWAPRAEQLGVASFLNDPQAVAEFREQMDAGLAERLRAMYDGFQSLEDDGYPVASINPQGAIYFSACFGLHGRQYDGKVIDTDGDIRLLLLEHAAVAVVPFQAFGIRANTGWFRLSAGAVSLEEIREMFPRIRALLDQIALDVTGTIDQQTTAALSVAGPTSSLDPGPNTPHSGGLINTGTTGPISGGTINLGPRHNAPTENLTKVANAFVAKTKSVTMLVTLPAGLNLTAPVQISILFESTRITQDYVNSSGNHFLYNFDDGDAKLRREPVAVTLHELAPGGQSYTFVWSIAIEPLYDISVTPLRFRLMSPCDLVGNSEPEIHWLNADGSTYEEEISLSVGQIHVFNAFAHDYTEVSVADELRVPFIWWWEIDPWPFTFHPNPDPGFENILSGPSRTVSFQKTDQGSPCMGKFIFTILVTLRWYPDL